MMNDPVMDQLTSDLPAAKGRKAKTDALKQAAYRRALLDLTLTWATTGQLPGGPAAMQQPPAPDPSQMGGAPGGMPPGAMAGMMGAAGGGAPQ